MNAKRGFTLVELLAVIVVLGFVLAVAIPNVIDAITNSYDKAYEHSLKVLKRVAKDYFIDKGIRVERK